MPCPWPAQLAQVVAQVVAQDLQTQHVRAAARACHAAALARLLLAGLSPLRGSTLPWCGPAAGPQMLRAVLSDGRASLSLAWAFPFAASFATFLHQFPSDLTEPLAHLFADLGWCLSEPLAHLLAALLGAPFGALRRGLAPHRWLWFLGKDNGCEQTRHEDQAFHSTASGAWQPATRFAAPIPQRARERRQIGGTCDGMNAVRAGPRNYLLSEASADRSSFFLCWSNQVRT